MFNPNAPKYQEPIILLNLTEWCSKEWLPMFEANCLTNWIIERECPFWEVKNLQLFIEMHLSYLHKKFNNLIGEDESPMQEEWESCLWTILGSETGREDFLN